MLIVLIGQYFDLDIINSITLIHLPIYFIFRLKHALSSWGDKFTPKEVADALDSMDIDKQGFINTEDVIQMLLSGGDEE